jgi:mannose-6-phosphate isomerase-like protein (cupin superfamily)
MANYTVKSFEDIPDVSGDYPGEMRMSAAGDLGNEQIAFTWRRMPPNTGGKGSYGHRHGKDEEIYFILEGTVQFKLEDEILALGAGQVVRCAPEVVRSVWNEGPEDVVLMVVGRRSEDPSADVEKVDGFWPDDEA